MTVISSVVEFLEILAEERLPQLTLLLKVIIDNDSIVDNSALDT